jgi:7,8-dihydropterin-6-yl-methyl-4-(beta-D-ribofuranosyl)aminobenzene 5'-phosphate synthase
MKITIIYDNRTLRQDLKADWGFSCLVEMSGKKILFDTGANGEILLDNMKKLDLDAGGIDEIVISHEHWDHTGGLSALLDMNPVRVYIPISCRSQYIAGDVIKVKDACEIHENIFSTGELNKIEQSLLLKSDKGLVVVVGCSHPGLESILNTAARFGNPIAVIGGLHGFDQFELIKDLELICPTHCTRHIAEIKSLYPDKYVEGGAGKIIEL